MAKHGRSAKQNVRKWERQKKQREAIRLRTMGWTLERIGQRVGVDDSTISDWIREEDERLQMLIDLGRESWLRQQIARVDLAQQLAFEGYKRSLRDSEEFIQTDGADGQSVTTKRRGQSGNPSYLAQVIKASERLATLLGLDAPAKETAPAAQQLPTRVVTVVKTTEQANRLRDEHTIFVDASEIKEVDGQAGNPATDQGPSPAADREAGPIPEPENAHKRVRGRARRRKD